MPIKCLDDVTGEALRQFREAGGQSMTAFWREIGVSKTRGSAYELGEKMPEIVRQLVYLHHIGGVRSDLPAEQLRRIADAIEGHKALNQSIASAERAAALMSKATRSN